MVIISKTDFNSDSVINLDSSDFSGNKSKKKFNIKNIFSGRKKNKKNKNVIKVNIFHGLTLKFFAVFFVITLVSVIVIETIPFNVIKSYISQVKEQEMVTLAKNFNFMIESYYNRLNKNDIEDVYDSLEYSDKGNLIITDKSGEIIFDSQSVEVTEGKALLLPEVIDGALENQIKFNAVFASEYFDFSIAYPIVLSNNVEGCFYLKQRDTDQCAKINRIKYFILLICAVILVFSIVIILIILIYMRKQINEINSLIYNIKSGNYDTKAKVISEDELGKLANEFNIMALRLKNIEDRRRRFVSDASHELKTPLATIKVLSEFILSCDDNNVDIATVREFMNDINSEIDRLTRVSDELIKLTKIDSTSENIKTKLVGVNVSKLTNRIIRIISNYAQTRSVTLEYKCAEDINVLATYDGLYEVLFNIIENAVKYNKENGFVSINVKPYNDEKIVIVIKDNGIGIPSEDVDKIFERFYRVDKARSRETGGTGLGLSVANDLVKAFGGRINVVSRVNYGTEFMIILDRADSDESDIEDIKGDL